MAMELSGDGTITGIVAGGLPNATVQQADLASGVSGTGPAFSAYQSSAQTTGAAWTKLQFQTELFDTNNNFDNTTNYRFTPTVAGYYCFIGQGWSSGGSNQVQLALYKNGSVAHYGPYITQIVQLTHFLYMNGTTDYVELYMYQAASAALTTGSDRTFFQGFLARGV